MPLLPENRLQWLYPVLKRPPGVTIGGLGVCRAGLRGRAIIGRQVVKSYSFMDTEMGERTDTDYSQI
jgi:hypothetical protein